MGSIGSLVSIRKTLRLGDRRGMYILRMEIHCSLPLFDQTKIPQKFFVDHDRYLHQKVRADNSTKFFQRIDQPKGNQYRKMRGKFVWFSMRSSLGPSIIDLILRGFSKLEFFSVQSSAASSQATILYISSREKSIAYIV